MTLGRTVWFFVKVAVVVAAAVWLADRPGHVSIDWLGYNIDLAVGTAMAVTEKTSAARRPNRSPICQ